MPRHLGIERGGVHEKGMAAAGEPLIEVRLGLDGSDALAGQVRAGGEDGAAI